MHVSTLLYPLLYDEDLSSTVITKKKNRGLNLSFPSPLNNFQDNKKKTLNRSNFFIFIFAKWKKYFRLFDCFKVSYINTTKLLTDNHQNSHKHAQKLQPINTTGHLFSFCSLSWINMFIYISRYNLENICRDTNTNWRLWSSSLHLPFKLWPHLWYVWFCTQDMIPHRKLHFFLSTIYPQWHSAIVFLILYIHYIFHLKILKSTYKNRGKWRPLKL